MNAVWVHGHNMQIEYPHLSEVIRRGYYSEVLMKQNSMNWFHFALPTAAVISNSRSRIESVLIRFRTSVNKVDSGTGPAYIGSVHVYDGEKRIAAYEHLELCSDSDQWQTKSFRIPKSHLEIMWGVGISILGYSPKDTVALLSHWIQFSSVGGHFTFET